MVIAAGLQGAKSAGATNLNVSHATAYLNVKYQKPTKPDRLYVVMCECTGEGRKITVVAYVMDAASREVVVTAEGLFVSREASAKSKL